MERRAEEKTKKIPLHLPARIEQDLAEWYQMYPLFCNLADEEYIDVGKKRALLDGKAAELTRELEEPVSRERLEKWLKSMRTMWGRLSTKKSGSGAKFMRLFFF